MPRAKSQTRSYLDILEAEEAAEARKQELPAVIEAPEIAVANKLEPEVGGPVVGLHFKGVPIHLNDSQFVNLTEMWVAADRPANKEPFQWKRKEGREFIAGLARTHNLPSGQVMEARRGKGVAGTWGHRQVALAYAKYLSPEFHRAVNDAFCEWVEEEIHPEKKVDRGVTKLKRLGWSDSEIVNRVEETAVNCWFREKEKEHGVHGYGYAACADTINRNILGKTSKAAKQERGLKKHEQLRDHLPQIDRSSLRLSEIASVALMEKEGARGNTACIGICDRSSKVIAGALQSLGIG